MQYRRPIPYTVNICGVSNGGFIVHVGCRTFAYGPHEITTLAAELAEYLMDPEKALAEFAGLSGDGGCATQGEPLNEHAEAMGRGRPGRYDVGVPETRP